MSWSWQDIGWSSFTDVEDGVRVIRTRDETGAIIDTVPDSFVNDNDLAAYIGAVYRSTTAYPKEG